MECRYLPHPVNVSKLIPVQKSASSSFKMFQFHAFTVYTLFPILSNKVFFEDIELYFKNNMSFVALFIILVQ